MEKEIKEIELSLRERTIIAEYIFSFKTDVLIKSDALDLIDLLSKKNLLSNHKSCRERVNKGSGNIAIMLNNYLTEIFGVSRINNIMNEYYGGNY